MVLEMHGRRIQGYSGIHFLRSSVVINVGNFVRKNGVKKVYLDTTAAHLYYSSCASQD
jgi:hypothetical protein